MYPKMLLTNNLTNQHAYHYWIWGKEYRFHRLNN